MGWQDAPVVEAPQQAAWMSAPEVGTAPAKPAQAERPTPSQVGAEMHQRVSSQLGGLVQGAADIGATLIRPFESAQESAARRAAVTSQLQSFGAQPESGAFGAGRMAGQIAGTAGVGPAIGGALRAVPALNPLAQAISSGGAVTGLAPTTMAGRAANLGLRAMGGAVTGGASAGLVSPEQAGTGATIGAILPGAMQVAGGAGRFVGNALRPRIANPELAAKALGEYQIPLGLGDIAASPTLRATRSVLGDLPITGGIGERSRESIKEAFTREVGRTFGTPETNLTAEVLDKAKGRMGAEFDRIWGNNTLQFDAQMFQRMQNLRTEAAKLPQGESARLSTWLDDIESKMVPGPNGELFMPGDVANNMQSGLRKASENATGFLKANLQDLRQGMISAFNRSVSADDVAALTLNRQQYKAFKTVQPLLESAQAGVAGREAGQIPAALLPQAVRQSYGERIAESPFADLTQIGSQYVADRVARTGGAPRAAIQNLAVGAGLGIGGYTNPLIPAVGIPAVIGVQRGLTSPALAMRAIAAQNAPPNALAALLANPELQQMILRSAPTVAAGR